MAAFKDITNQRFGRLVAIRSHGKTKHGHTEWLCQCDCGGTKITVIGSLSSGETKSCGCLQKEWATKKAIAAKIDMKGKKFGRLTVIKSTAKDHYGQYLWLCKCECGNLTTVRGGDIRSGSTISCGCASIKHGMAGTPTYASWGAMKCRCYNHNASNYKQYGGRGITVCDRWRNSFASFLSDMGERPNDTTLDRINTNGNYYPDNCRWATSKEQSRNRRNNHMITYNKSTKCLIEWAEEYGMTKHTLLKRILYGWDVKRALNTPLRGRNNERA